MCASSFDTPSIQCLCALCYSHLVAMCAWFHTSNGPRVKQKSEDYKHGGDLQKVDNRAELPTIRHYKARDFTKCILEFSVTVEAN